MRHLMWLVLLLAVQVGCGKGGNQVIDTPETPPAPKTQQQIEAEMSNKGDTPAP